MSRLALLILTVFNFRAFAVLKPVVVFVHGGAWVGGSASDYHALAARLEKSGLCVKLLDYRLASAAKHPAPVEDLEAALKNLKLEKHCDLKKIYLLGHSAGAHVIAFWASAHARAEVKAMIGLEGIYDIPKLVQIWPAYEDQFIRAEFGASADWIAASPNRLTLKDRAHWLLIHSTADELVDLKQSTDFADHLRGQKISVKLVKVEKENHFGVVTALEKPSAILKNVTDFIGAKHD